MAHSSPIITGLIYFSAFRVFQWAYFKWGRQGVWFKKVLTPQHSLSVSLGTYQLNGMLFCFEFPYESYLTFLTRRKQLNYILLSCIIILIFFVGILAGSQ